jgi:hypothetical protein
VETTFGYARMPVMSFPDVYAGKLCAALDRQHPRDLFDVKWLLENEGLTEPLRKTFLVYLISANRPMAELLNPNRKDIRGIYRGELLNMTEISVTVEELEETREKLIQAIHYGLTLEEKQFLLSFKRRVPDWSLLGLEGIEHLPAVHWKLLNLSKMPPDKHQKAVNKLQSVMGL